MTLANVACALDTSLKVFQALIACTSASRTTLSSCSVSESDTSPLAFSFLLTVGTMSFALSGTLAPNAVSVNRSAACALSPPVINGEALITATGLPQKSPEDTVQSSAFLREPGTPKRGLVHIAYEASKLTLCSSWTIIRSSLKSRCTPPWPISSSIFPLNCASLWQHGLIHLCLFLRCGHVGKPWKCVRSNCAAQ